MAPLFFDGWYFALAAMCGGVPMPIAIRARSLGYDVPRGVRKVHRTATSRLGGVVIVISGFVVLGIAPKIGDHDLAGVPLLVLAALPVVLVGLAEDLTGSVRPAEEAWLGVEGRRSVKRSTAH